MGLLAPALRIELGKWVRIFRFRGDAPCNRDWVLLMYNHMVVSEKESEDGLNQLFRALADGTRRDILARSLTERP